MNKNRAVLCPAGVHNRPKEDEDRRTKEKKTPTNTYLIRTENRVNIIYLLPSSGTRIRNKRGGGRNSKGSHKTYDDGDAAHAAWSNRLFREQHIYLYKKKN